jgi:hypothetical protein
LPSKIVEEHPKNLSLLTTPRNVLSTKQEIAITNNGCKSYYYDKIIGLMRRYAWHGKYAVQCNLSKLSGIGIPAHIYGSNCFTT